MDTNDDENKEKIDLIFETLSKDMIRILEDKDEEDKDNEENEGEYRELLKETLKEVFTKLSEKERDWEDKKREKVKLQRKVRTMRRRKKEFEAARKLAEERQRKVEEGCKNALEHTALFPRLLQ